MKVAVVNPKQASPVQLAHRDFMSKELKKAKYKGKSQQEKMQLSAQEWKKYKKAQGIKAKPTPKPKKTQANWGTGKGAKKGWGDRKRGSGAGTRVTYGRGGSAERTGAKVYKGGQQVGGPGSGRSRSGRRTRSNPSSRTPAWQALGYPSAEAAIRDKISTTYGQSHMVHMAQCLQSEGGGKEAMKTCARQWKAIREGKPGFGQDEGGKAFIVMPKVYRHVMTKDGVKQKVLKDVVVRRATTTARYGTKPAASNPKYKPVRYNAEEGFLQEWLGFPEWGEWFPTWEEVKEHPLAAALGGIVVGPAFSSLGYNLGAWIVPDEYPVVGQAFGLFGSLVATETSARITGWIVDDWFEWGTGGVIEQSVRLGGLITTGIWTIVALYKLFKNDAFHDLADEAKGWVADVKKWLGLGDEVTSGYSQGYSDPYVGDLTNIQDRIGQLAADLGLSDDQMARIEQQVDEELYGVGDSVIPPEPDDIYEGEYI